MIYVLMGLVHGLYLGAMLGAILLGVLLGRFLLLYPRTTHLASAASGGVLLGICLLCLLPEAHELLTQAATKPWHWHAFRIEPYTWVGIFTALGFLSLLTIERFLFAGHTHSSCATHAEHSHASHSLPHDAHERSAAWSLLFTLCLHGLFDGIGLQVAEDLPKLGWALGGSLILHKIPETASLVTVLRRAHVRFTTQLLALGLYTGATVTGLFAAHQLHQRLTGYGIALLMAFSAGALLHLVTGHLLPETISPNPGQSKGTYRTMVLGFLLILGARILGSG